eukprot:6206066-Pleurochrysis_carterae.AAC.2
MIAMVCATGVSRPSRHQADKPKWFSFAICKAGTMTIRYAKASRGVDVVPDGARSSRQGVNSTAVCTPRSLSRCLQPLFARAAAAATLIVLLGS